MKMTNGVIFSFVLSISKPTKYSYSFNNILVVVVVVAPT